MPTPIYLPERKTILEQVQPALGLATNVMAMKSQERIAKERLQTERDLAVQAEAFERKKLAIDFLNTAGERATDELTGEARVHAMTNIVKKKASLLGLDLTPEEETALVTGAKSLKRMETDALVESRKASTKSSRATATKIERITPTEDQFQRSQEAAIRAQEALGMEREETAALRKKQTEEVSTQSPKKARVDADEEWKRAVGDFTEELGLGRLSGKGIREWMNGFREKKRRNSATRSEIYAYNELQRILFPLYPRIDIKMQEPWHHIGSPQETPTLVDAQEPTTPQAAGKSTEKSPPPGLPKDSKFRGEVNGEDIWETPDGKVYAWRP